MIRKRGKDSKVGLPLQTGAVGPAGNRRRRPKRLLRSTVIVSQRKKRDLSVYRGDVARREGEKKQKMKSLISLQLPERRRKWRR